MRDTVVKDILLKLLRIVDFLTVSLTWVILNLVLSCEVTMSTEVVVIVSLAIERRTALMTDVLAGNVFCGVLGTRVDR